MLHLHNSLSDTKEPFEPIHPGKATLYVCGPTVYSESHLGHAKTYVGFDVVLRYLQYSGYKTFYVQNITDVGHLVDDAEEGEDKIERKAREADTEPMAIADKYTRYHQQCMDALGVQAPDIAPRATGHIPEQIEAIQTLIDNGYAYEADGSVYFDVSKDPEYGTLSNRTIEELLDGARVAVRDDKRNPCDFALWKKAEAGHIMRWKDPWSGYGYPGWHIECSVMSAKYLGEEFDIHGGGLELKFPHHDCEIAQARGLGHGFAKYWLHSNMLTINGCKMSKSTGNFVTLTDAFKKHDPLVVRYCIVASHYRSVLDYSIESLDAAQTGLQRLHHTVRNLRRLLPENATPSQTHFQDYKKRFCAHMDDDFSTPQALAVLFELNKEVNTLLNSDNPNLDAIIDAEALYSELGGAILGIIPEQLESADDADSMDSVMQVLLEIRQHAREQKDYATSDKIRDRLKDANIVIHDGKDGATWEKVSS